MFPGVFEVSWSRRTRLDSLRPLGLISPPLYTRGHNPNPNPNHNPSLGSTSPPRPLGAAGELYLRPLRVVGRLDELHDAEGLRVRDRLR
eukprot:3826885-Prymnesium_polylepis.3